MIWEKFISKSRGGQVTPLAPSWGRPWVYIPSKDGSRGGNWGYIPTGPILTQYYFNISFSRSVLN